MSAASIIASVVTGGSNSHQTVSEELNNVATDFVSQGVVGAFTSGSPNTGAFGVTQDASADMGVTVLSGRAYVSGTPTGQDAQVLSARMTSNYTNYTINANSSGSTKYDWIYLSLSSTNANTPSSAADNVITLYTSRSTSNATDNGSPPTYGLLLGIVTVANGAATITNGNITDKRVQSSLSVQSAATTGWQTLANALTYGVNNGSKEFTATTPTDITGTISPGMKLKITRSVTPPTQCMAFVSASSNYATKASPTGITFTSAFTCESWIYLNSYTNVGMVIDRMDTTGANGFDFYVDATGRPTIDYVSSSSHTTWATYQSIPLNQWVHVAAAVSSVSSKTLGGIYINGTSVPTQNTAAATTTLTQAGNLTLGANNAGGTPANFLNGYLSEVRVWSVAQTQSAIQSNMGINLVGNETNLVVLVQGSGSANDSTSNANNLTLTNGASATQANNPYNGTEYFNVIAASYSNPNTTLTLDGGTQNVLPNQTLNTPNYSTASSPLGLPANLKKYMRYVPLCNTYTTPGNTTPNQVNGLTQAITIPSGSPRVTITACGQDFGTNTGAATINLTVWDGVVISGTQLARNRVTTSAAGNLMPNPNVIAIVTPTAGSHTYNVGLQTDNSGDTSFMEASTTAPAFLKVEVDL